jgi:hypothetical protein
MMQSFNVAEQSTAANTPIQKSLVDYMTLPQSIMEPLELSDEDRSFFKDPFHEEVLPSI